jgi:hypothetical protein
VIWEAGTLAIPKSMTFGSPPARIMMLAGLMSRWMTARAWACWRASATRPTTRRASRHSSEAPSAVISASVRPLEVLEGDEERARGRVPPRVVHDHDPGMGQGRGHARLGQEALLEEPALALGQGEGQAHGLEGHGPAQHGIEGAVDDAHHPAPDLFLDLVAAQDLEVRSRQERALPGRTLSIR